VVRANGDIDLATASQLDQALQAAVTEAQSWRHLVLDLAAVTFMDCPGLSTLVAAKRRLGDRFWLANPSPRVLHLLDLAGLTGTLAVADCPPAIGPILTLEPGAPKRDTRALDAGRPAAAGADGAPSMSCPSGTSTAVRHRRPQRPGCFPRTRWGLPSTGTSRL